MDFTGYAEHAVAAAVDLVNSLGADSGTDRLTDLDVLSRWLAGHGFHGGRLRRADLDEIKAVRARLRDVFEAAEASDEAGAVAAINGLLSDFGALPHLTDHDGQEWHLHFAAMTRGPAARVAATAAMGLAGIVSADGFGRLRVCDWESCGDVFVDMSRNRSRRYCSPDVCGNRASVAAYRRRKQSRDATSGDSAG